MNGGLYLVFALMLFVIGCSKPSISGTVKFNDKLIGSGQIRLVPEDEGKAEISATIHTGKFNVQQDAISNQLNNDIAGKYEVLVDVYFVDASEAEGFYADAMENGGGGPNSVKQAISDVSYIFEASLKNGKNVLSYNIKE